MSNVMKFWQVLPSCWLILGIFHNFWPILASFGYFLYPLAPFCNFFWQLLPSFGNIEQFGFFLATLGKFKPLWADFDIFLAAFGCSHKLLDTFMNFCHFLAIFVNVSHFFVNLWQLLPLTMSSSHLIILPSLHSFILSSCQLSVW